MLLMVFFFFIYLNIYKKFFFMILGMFLLTLNTFSFLNSIFFFLFFFLASLGGLSILYSFIIFLAPMGNFLMKGKVLLFGGLLFLFFLLESPLTILFMKEFKIFLVFVYQEMDSLWVFFLMYLILVLSMNLMNSFPGPYMKFFY